MEVSNAEEIEAALAHARRASVNWTTTAPRGAKSLTGVRDDGDAGGDAGADRGRGGGSNSSSSGGLLLAGGCQLSSTHPIRRAGAAAHAIGNCAHAFVRVTVIREPDGVVSQLHLVDLIGAQSLAGAGLGLDPDSGLKL